MPVILTTEAEIERWMTAPAEDALRLQRPLPDGALEIVATASAKTKPRNSELAFGGGSTLERSSSLDPFDGDYVLSKYSPKASRIF